MEIEESNRPSVGFPLGLALLLILLLFMCGFFTCCIHWDKLRSVLGISTDDENSLFQHDLSSASPHKSPPPQQEAKKKQAESLPVVMPGDQVPKFIAIACPCEPPVLDKITVNCYSYRLSSMNPTLGVVFG